jgi:hypothetical protein
MLKENLLSLLLLGALVLALAACTSVLASDSTTPAAPATPVLTGTLTSTAAANTTGSINGWLWHDTCAVSGQSIGAGKDTIGCVQDGDHYRADGIKENNETIIPYVKVSLGTGPCPSSGLAETDTVATDLSYSFTGLAAGTYCVSIDPLAEANSSILHGGAWSYPNRQDGLIATTVKLSAGENEFDVNFGWDYTNLPSTQSTACTYRATFLGDVSVPDNAVVAPASSFIKTWRLRNDGDCAWGPGQYVHTLLFINGDHFGAPDEIPLLATTPPGGVTDVSINMVAPQPPGTYRSEWMLMVAEGPLFGVGQDGQTPLYAQIIVRGPATPMPVPNGTSGKITDQSIGIELEQGSGAACAAQATYFVHAQITADGPTTATYEIGSTAGQIPAGNFQSQDNNGLSPYITGAVVFDQAGAKTIHLRFVGPYPYPDDITVNLRVNGGEWHNTKLSCP